MVDTLHAPGEPEPCVPLGGRPSPGIAAIASRNEAGWFAARPSGTEDVYKIYAESFRGPDHLAQLQAEAQDIVSAAFADAGV